MSRLQPYNKGDWKKICWLLFALFIGLRLAFLDADPPEQLNWAWGEWVDAGNYSYNARNEVLFDKWELDDWNLMWVAPIPHWFTYLVFKLLGVGFWQNNLVPALFSCGTVLIFYFLLKQTYSITYAYLGAALLGLNYLMITYARVGNRISEMIFFLVLSAYFWQKGFSKSFYFYLAGICSMCAFLSKGSMVVFFIAMFLATVVSPVTVHGWKQCKKWLSPTLLYSSGVVTLIIFWYLVLVLPHTRIYDIFIGKDIKFRTPFSFDKLLSNVWQTPIAHYFFMYIPIIFSFSLLFLLLLSYHLLERIKYRNPDESESRHPLPLEVLALLWFLGDFFFNTIINYRPLRFFVSAIPSLIIIFIALLRYLWELRSFKIPRLSFIYMLVIFIWIFFVLHYFINEDAYYLYSIMPLKMFSYIMLPPPMSYYEAYKTLFFFSLLFCVVFYLLARLLQGKTISFNPLYAKIVCILLFAASVAYQAYLYYDWVTKYKSYKIITYSRFLMDVIPKGPISGNIAPMFCFENELKAYLIYRDRNNWYNHPFERYSITHMQMARPHDERDGYFYGFQDIMNKSKVITAFPLKGRTEELWKINPSPRPYMTWAPYSAEETTTPDKIKFINKDMLLRHSLWIIPASSPSSDEVITFRPGEVRIMDYNFSEVIIKPADYNLEIEQGNREVGMPVYDLDASLNIAIRSDKRQHSVIYIQQYHLPPGRFLALLRIKYEKPATDFKKIEIRFYREDGDLFAHLSLPTNKNANQKYATYSGIFTNPLDQRLIIEISNPETDTMYFDVLQIIPEKETSR